MNFNYEILPILISLLGISMLILVRKNVFKRSYLFSFWVSGIVFFSAYIFIILTTVAVDAYYWSEYYSYDSNKNGIVEEYEKTDGHIGAQRRVVSDTARQMVFITGAIASLIISTTVLVVGLIRNYIMLRRIRLKKTRNNA